MGLSLAGVPHRKGGLMAGLDSLVSADSMDAAALALHED
jgi:hypothetical protein